MSDNKIDWNDFTKSMNKMLDESKINKLKFHYLEPVIAKFFEDFAKASQQDGQLTNNEVERLKKMYDDIINSAEDMNKDNPTNGE